MKKVIKGIKLLVVMALAFAYIGCDEDDAVLPQVEAGFTQTVNQDNGLVTFINTSTNADNFAWDFGDGTTSTEINPQKVYETGTYTVVLEATNVAGATSTFEDVITVQIPEEIAFPITFDNPLVAYEATVFNGASFEVVENPDPSGTNTDVSNVGAITNSGAAFEGLFFGLGEALNLSTDKSLKIDFWSTSALDILVKLEQGTGADVEISASHGGTGWEELYFTFDSGASFSQLTIFVDGPGTTSGTFYFDNIEQLNTADVPCLLTDLEIPIDFDCNGIDYATKIVGNVNFMVVENPEQSGINAEATQVGQITNVGANFENAFFNLDVPIDFSVDTGVRMKLFSNQALPILLKFEGGTEADVENSQNHGGTGWEELTFTLNSTGSYNDMVIFVDGPGTAAGTFYVDDIEQVSGTPPPPPFDDGLLTNGDFEAGSDSWISGVGGPAAPVVTESGNTFYQVNVGAVGTPFSVNLSQQLEIMDGETYTLSFDAWTDAGADGRTLIAGVGRSGNPDFANANTNETVGLSNPVLSTTPTRFEYTFMSVPGAADGRVLFDMGDQLGLVNIDNVRLVLGGGSGGGCTGGPTMDVATFPVDFEDCEGFNVSFGDGQTREIVDNPVSGGINTSDKVYQFVKTAGGSGFGGFQNVFNTGSFTNSSTVTFKIYSTLPNQEVRLEIVAIPNDGSIGNPAPYTQTLVESGQWVEMSFDLSGNDFPNADETVYTQLVVKPGNVDPGSTPADVTFYIDDFNVTN